MRRLFPHHYADEVVPPAGKTAAEDAEVPVTTADEQKSI